MRLLSIVLFVVLFSFGHAQVSETLSSPPSQLPVKVETIFYLIDLVSIDGKNESFRADVYYSFRWHDSRLAFENRENTPKVYLEERAEDRLKEIWWPEIEFPTAGLPIYNNRGLFIYPNGTVEYYIGIAANFRSKLDFSRFPFDKQTLKISINSFSWDKSILEFVRVPGTTMSPPASEAHAEVVVVNVQDSIGASPNPFIGSFEASPDYSTYQVFIDIERKYGFFLYQVFTPLLLVFGIAMTVLFGFKEPFLDRVMVGLTAFLVFLAAKFTINQDLPQLGYMTIVDKAFIASYCTIALIVLVSVIQKLWLPSQEARAEKLDRHARIFIPLLFLLFLAFIYFFQ